MTNLLRAHHHNPQTSANQINNYEGLVYFKTQSDFQLLYMVLEGSDLYCYGDETREKLKFMHSMVSCHIRCDEGYQIEIKGKQCRQIQIKLSESFKRVFYLSCPEDKNRWLEKLTKPTRQRNFEVLYDKEQLLGEGFFGKVYRVKSRETGETCAVKIIEKTKMQQHELQLHFNEIEVLKVCSDHKNIVNLIDYMEDGYYIYMITELVDGPDLFDYIKRVEVNERALKDIMSDLCSGLAYCHELGIVHRDIKLENIMIGLTQIPSADGSSS
jgi:Protein kinase domain